MTDIIQGSDEWFQLRCGKVTASRIGDLMAKTKSGWGASRKNYEAEKIAEILTGQPAASFSSAAMQWGTDHEPEARTLYEFMHDVDVMEIGFIAHPTIEGAGASPDGLVGADGMLEIKCPNTATHIDTLLNKKVPQKYIYQMQFQMACCERKWCDYMSYDPRMPEKLDTFLTRIERDDALIKEIEDSVIEFVDAMNEKIKRLEEE